MKFLKLVFAEIKKIILKPSLIILVGLLIACLCVCGFTYNPVNKTANNINISGSTVSEVKSKFYGTAGTYTKKAYDDRFNNDVNGAYAYVVIANQDNSVYKAQLIEYVNTLELSFNKFINNVENETADVLIMHLNQFEKDLDLYNTNLNNKLSLSVPNIYIQNKAYLQIQKDINDINNMISVINDYSTTQDLKILKTKLLNSEKVSNLISLSKNGIKAVSINKKTADYLTEVYNNAINKCSSQNEIINNYEDSNLSLIIKKYNIEISKYFDIQNQAKIIISCSFYNAITTDVSSLFGYTSYDEYKNNSTLVKNQYLFDNDLYSFEVADSFNMESTSNTVTNGYDFMFYAIQAIMFIIIIYSVIMATSSIANEYSSGTIKLLLIRPYSRKKVLSAKILSVIIISSFFIIVSCLISLIIGFILYGTYSAPILVNIETLKATLMSPIVLTLIFLLTLLFKCTIYILLTVLIATIFKNPIPALVLTLGIYFAGIVCNIFISGNSWAMLLPFANFDLFNYFMPISNNQLGNLFIGNYKLTSIFYSIIYDIIIILLCTIPTYKVFQNSDI